MNNCVLNTLVRETLKIVLQLQQCVLQFLLIYKEVRGGGEKRSSREVNVPVSLSMTAEISSKW